MEAFKKHTGIVAILDRANVDTDQIIAKQFLKSIKRTGFGEQLFYDWRYQEDGTPNADFEMNEARYDGASILVARNNFGCGSSREHAVWAIAQYGLKVVIAPWKGEGNERLPGFADIFKNNCCKNGLLTIELSESDVDEIFELVKANEGLQSTVDLETQTLTFHTPEEKVYSFEYDAAVKERLLNGLDDIGMTLQRSDSVDAFEQTHPTYLH